MKMFVVRLSVSILAITACSDPATPHRPAGIDFDAPAALRDTIEAIVPSPITVTLTGEDRRPLAHTTISIEARNGFPSPTLAVDSAGSLAQPRVHSATTDGRGRVTTYLRLGSTAGAGYLVVRGAELVDSLRFDVLPGAMAGIAALPADTSLGVGAMYELSVRAIDRRSNQRPEPVTSFTVQSLTPHIATVQGSTVATQGIGRAALRVAAAGREFDAFVSAVPPGTAAALRGGRLVLLDLRTGTGTMSVGDYENAQCAGWHPAGDRLLLSGLRIVTLAGITTHVSTVAAGLITYCGEFTANGEWIYFAARHYAEPLGVSRIWRIRPDGTQLEPVTPEVLNGWTYLFSPSPDGTQVAYVVGGPLKYVVVRTIGTAQVDTVSGPVEGLGFTGFTSVKWSPDGDWIAYSQTSSELVRHVDKWTTIYGSHVTLVRPDGSESRQLVPPGGDPHASAVLGGVTWSPDGAWLIGRHWRWEPEAPLVLIDAATAEALPLHAGTREYAWPVWRP